MLTESQRRVWERIVDTTTDLNGQLAELSRWSKVDRLGSADWNVLSAWIWSQHPDGAATRPSEQATVDGRVGDAGGRTDEVRVHLGRASVAGVGGVVRVGRVLYLPGRALIAVVVDGPGGGQGEIVASLAPRRRGRWISVGRVELATGLDTMTVSPTGDPDGYALVWLWRTWRQRAGGRTVQVARELVHHARLAGTVRLVLTREAVRGVRDACRLSDWAVREMLARLVALRLLGAEPSTQDVGGWRYTLTMPRDRTDPFGDPRTGVG